ncbi:MAG: DUF268 domain-containing protein [Syntrophobacteraceae bacterium]|nr:DUF268 domain-containing protein [Syntrophobacteraceae bacterium]
MTETILEGPTEWSALSEELKERFTLSGRIPVSHWLLRENTANKVGNPWPTQAVLYGILQAARRRDLEGIRSYDARSVYDLYKALDKYPVAYKDVVVIGSLRPWIEVCCLAFGARSVTTVDYNPPISEYEEIRTVGVEAFEKEIRTYDMALSYSSLEHDGLGRYGDAIDPDGDLKRMASYVDLLNPGGLFLLGVPNGQDALFWNAHRIYGKIRFPMLTEKWRILDFFLDGFTRKRVLSLKDTYEQGWWVLRK